MPLLETATIRFFLVFFQMSSLGVTIISFFFQMPPLRTAAISFFFFKGRLSGLRLFPNSFAVISDVDITHHFC